MASYHQEFPFEEFRQESGDYFDTVQQALEAGYQLNQIWSVVCDDESNTYTYGPSRHYVNRIGYVATKETHDDDTYYHDEWEVMDDDVNDEDEDEDDMSL